MMREAVDPETRAPLERRQACSCGREFQQTGIVVRLAIETAQPPTFVNPENLGNEEVIYAPRRCPVCTRRSLSADRNRV